MSLSDQARRVFQEVGLTEYETRVYHVLLKHGVLTASTISEYGKVPYSKVYETLNSLERKGWVEADRGRPNRYYPKSPSEALEAVKLRLEDMVTGWKHVVDKELQPIYEHRELLEKPDIWILRGEFSTIAKLQEMVGRARHKIMVAAPGFVKNYVDSAIPVLTGLIERNVEFSLLVTKEWETQVLKRFGEVRRRDSMFGGGVIVDNREALLFLGEEKPSLVIWSNHAGLVKFAATYFEFLWDNAE